MSRLKIGVVGVGIGRIHLEAYRTLTDSVEIVAACDLNENRLNQIADEYNIPLRYNDYLALFSSGQIEAVSICLPTSLHAPVSIAALEAGLHVLCEKPLAENTQMGQKIVEAAAKAPGKFMICFNRRYRPDVQWIKALIDEGGLGQIYQIKTGWVRETGIPGWTAWFTDKQIAGGGPLIDLGVHMLEAAMWLLNYPRPQTVSGDVRANFGQHGRKTWLRPGDADIRHAFNVEDSATAFIRLEGDISLNLEASWASHTKPGKDDFFMTVMGTEGTVELYVPNYATEDTLKLYTELGGRPVTIQPHVSRSRTDHGYAITEFVKCIQQDLPPTASAEDGLTISKMIDAIYKSSDLKREVLISD